MGRHTSMRTVMKFGNGKIVRLCLKAMFVNPRLALTGFEIPKECCVAANGNGDMIVVAQHVHGHGTLINAPQFFCLLIRWREHEANRAFPQLGQKHSAGYLVNG